MKNNRSGLFNKRLDASRLRTSFQYEQLVSAGYRMPYLEKMLLRSGKSSVPVLPSVDRSLLFPPEYIYALECRGHDVIPVTTDVLVAATTILDPKSAQEALQAAGANGYKASCSFQQMAYGLSMQGMLPPYRAGFLMNEPCIGSLETFNQILRKKNTPVYNLYVPGEYSHEAIDFIKRQFIRINTRIEQDTGGDIRFDIDKLRMAIRNSNMAREHFQKGMDCMKGAGSLLGAWEFLNFNLFCSGGFGSPEYVEIAKSFSSELAERRGLYDKHIDQPIGLPRIYQVHFPPYASRGILNNIEKQCDLVAADINTIWWDEINESDPIEGLARKLLVRPGCGFNARERVKTCHRPVLESYNIDGIICFQHMYGTNCPLATETNINMLRNEIQQINSELNKNMLMEVIPLDCLQSTNIPVNADTRIDAFFETLRQVKGLPPFKFQECVT